MGKVFTRKQFSDYLGEQRAILDVDTSYFTDPSPSPTPTPSPSAGSPTPTPSSTPTPTPSPIPQFNIGAGFDNTTQSIFIDGDDNIFVGGLFYGFNGTPSWGMVKMDTNGGISDLFAAGSNTMLYSSTINGITEDETGNYIYVYGSFVTPSQRIAKIDKTTGLNVWSGLTLVTNGSVNSVAVDQATGDVYIGGSFTAVQGQTRNRIAKLDSSGSLDVSVFAGAALNNTVNNLFLNRNGNLICVGTFTTYFGVAATRLIEIETSTYTKTALWGAGQSGGGNLDSIFQRTDNGEYVCVGNTTYTINGASPNYVGKYNESGVNIPFTNTGIPIAIPIGLYLDEVNNYMYIGNSAGYGNSGTLRVSLVNGVVDSTFTTNIGSYLPKTMSVQPLTKIIQLDSSNRIYRIGTFVFINGDGYNRIVRYLQDGTINTISA
jgi:hypothetical protein